MTTGRDYVIERLAEVKTSSDLFGIGMLCIYIAIAADNETASEAVFHYRQLMRNCERDLHTHWDFFRNVGK
jgi:hypothetical protein